MNYYLFKGLSNYPISFKLKGGLLLHEKMIHTANNSDARQYNCRDNL